MRWRSLPQVFTPPGSILSGMGSSGERLHLQLPYLSPGYSVQGVSGFRVDPPGEGLHPVYSEKEALGAFWRIPTGRMCAQSQATATARFGLYTGNQVDMSPDGRLTGSAHAFTAPAWLVLVGGLIHRSSGPSRDSRSTPEQPRSSAEGRRNVSGYAVHVVRDGAGESLSDLVQVGGPGIDA